MAMRALSVLPLAASLLGQVIADPRVVPMQIQRRERRGMPLRRRSSPQSVAIGNAEAVSLYYVNCTVGTPPQPVQLQIDTGSSDVWMFGSDACAAASCSGGDFKPEDSSTYHQIGASGLFEIQYVTPGSGVSGNYFGDNFELGPIKLTNLTMAVATQAQAVYTGIMGIGFTDDESIFAESNGQVQYPSIVDVMYNESVIASHSYSLWLDDLEASTGTVLFGGYDTGKYHDPLTVLDIQPDSQSGIIDSFTVAWSFMAVSDSSGTTLLNANEFPLPAVLDSGTTLTVVPDDLFQQLATYFNATNEGQNYGYLVPCSNGNWQGAIDYGFGGDNNAVIQVPFSELALPAYNTNGEPLQFEDGTLACAFAFEPAGQDSPILLGDTFLRSAYVIYDLEAKQVAIAQTNYNSSVTNIKEIPAGNDLVSILGSAASAATSVSVTQTASGQVGPGHGSATGSVVAPSDTGFAGVSHVSGIKTTLAISSPLTGAVTGSAAPAPSDGSSTSSAGAAGMRTTAHTQELAFLFASCFAVFAGGAALMAFF